MLFSQDIGIDLGTSNTLVFVKGKGIIIREPSVVAVDQRFTPVKVVAVGSEAKDMIGRTPGSIVALRPLRDGVIADFDATAEMLKKFIRKAITASPLSKTRVMICVPSGVTEVERRAVNDAAKSAGARYVSLIEEPMAAAIGAGIDVEKPEGSMIVDIGGGTAEVAVVALSDIVTSRSVKGAGDSYDESIMSEKNITFLSAKERPRIYKFRSAPPMNTRARAQSTLRAETSLTAFRRTLRLQLLKSERLSRNRSIKSSTQSKSLLRTLRPSSPQILLTMASPSQAAAHSSEVLTSSSSRR